MAGRSAIENSTVVIGEPNYDGYGYNVGGAIVYTRSGSTWSYATTLTPSDPNPGEGFGTAVAINSSRIVVGSPYWDGVDNSTPDQGRAFVFEGSGSSWVRAARLTADGGLPQAEAVLEGNPGDYFGESVAISGNFVVVGAPGYDGTALNEGAAYAFYRFPDSGSGNGASWTRATGGSGSGRMNAASPAGADAPLGDGLDQYRTADRFGTSVAVGGSRIVIGMPGYNETNSSNVAIRADVGAMRTYSTDTVLPTGASSMWAEVLSDPQDASNSDAGRRLAVRRGDILRRRHAHAVRRRSRAQHGLHLHQ